MSFKMADSYTMSPLTCKTMRILILLALPSLLAAEKKCVQGVTYLDTVTGNCDPCSDICDHALAQGTRARCNRHCKGYNVAKALTPQCPAGHYYDQNVERCDHCDTICLPPQQDDCRTLCPDWAISTTTRRTQTNSDQKNMTYNHSSMSARQTSDDLGSNNFKSYILLIGIGVLFAIVLAVVGYLLKKPCANAIKKVTTRRCNRQSTQEQGQSSYPMLNTTIVRSPEDV